MSVPSEGTRLRRIYDRLSSGQWEDLSDLAPSRDMSSIKEQLAKHGMRVLSRTNITLMGKGHSKKEYISVR